MHIRRHVYAVLAVVMLAGIARSQTVAFAEPIEEASWTRADQIEHLIRIWADAKWLHPDLASGHSKWDEALEDALKGFGASNARALSDDAFAGVVQAMLSQIGDPATSVIKRAASSPPAPGITQAPRVSTPEQGTILIDATDIAQLARPLGFGSQGTLSKSFQEAMKDEPEHIIIDLRYQGPSTDSVSENWMVSEYWFGESVRRDLVDLVTQPVPLYAKQARAHHGYTPAYRETSGSYFSGTLIREAPLLIPPNVSQASQPAAAQPHLTFLINDRADQFAHALFALQDAQIATVILDGKPGDAFIHADDLSARSLPGDHLAVIRTARPRFASGTTAWKPILFDVEAERDIGGDAIAFALTMPSLPAAEMESAIVPVRTLESPVARDMERSTRPISALPKRERRLLALARLWTVFDRFFPYRDLTDDPWDDQLGAFLSKFEEADSAEAYWLAIERITAKAQDTHVSVTSRHPAFVTYRPRYAAPFHATFIDGEFVITSVHTSAIASLRVGDIVTHLDGEDIHERAERLTESLSFSSPAGLDFALGLRLFRGGIDEPMKLTILREDEVEPIDVEQFRFVGALAPSRVAAKQELSVIDIDTLADGLAYVDLTRLQTMQVQDAVRAMQSAEATIFDLRGYPRGTAWMLANQLSPEPTPAAMFNRPMFTGFEYNVGLSTAFVQSAGNGNPDASRYDKPVYVLIDHNAISQSEHTALFFNQLFENITYIGSPTAAANGDVTELVLPGDVIVGFTGQSVKHPDGAPLQRVGIQPDIPVYPSLDGVRKGVDEVMLTAIDLFYGSKELPTHP